LEVTVQLGPFHRQLELFGPADSHLRLLRQDLKIQITARRDHLTISGDEKNVAKAAEILDMMKKTLLKRGTLTTGDVESFLAREAEM